MTLHQLEASLASANHELVTNHEPCHTTEGIIAKCQELQAKMGKAQAALQKSQAEAAKAAAEGGEAAEK
jgi:hypothetical protein